MLSESEFSELILKQNILKYAFTLGDKREISNEILKNNKLTLLSFSLNRDEYKISNLTNKINNFSVEDLTSNKSWLLEKVLELR